MAMTRRQRASAFRAAQYALLLVIILVFAFTANWTQLRHSFFNLEAAAKQFPDVITVALKNTIVYTVLGFSLGLALGLVLALMRLSSVGPYRWFARAYIEFFRGLPALLIFIAVGTGIPLAFPGTSLNRNVAIMVSLGIISAAYMAETIRAGIQAVPRGQIEAARSLGMSPGRAMITIVIPQAFRIVLPPLANELIMLTKDTSLAFLLATTPDQQELAQFARQALNTTQSLTPILVGGLCYLVITIPLSLVQQRLERRFGAGVKPGGGV
ncbi:amino acid ABC transporter permease [Solihabitans fulvus]|uniref:Amino acid ABC transporter permease n=1 Tax=Solihabitans fulvus TaxID=1892852 RepID=A0A5B2XJ64_9PSEU|nr:amino acid ABC transporter permease [Solihabitans fulvus]KAA2263453.1 amino acid ABC transporter permease [Solihabitans fulvus]